ncbi:hypothetical protein A8990_1395 [Paenibacillus taihuensis]|uniref:Spore coat protein D n=1 Tax=Paenibacillus taihuensis TaxID=1156355 RepID=A0A3D9QV40_9BACL|nr:hypothetical protein [Paenibacillus taihuensis]REE68016.1 hypothetical protein A8990_1395 [Paenibacillus taihuensis]
MNYHQALAGAGMGPGNNVAGANTGGEFCPDCPTQTMYDPPVTLYEDVYHPQLVNVVHAVNVVKQHHCCPVYNHCYTYSETDVMARGKKARVSSAKRAKKSTKKRSRK